MAQGRLDLHVFRLFFATDALKMGASMISRESSVIVLRPRLAPLLSVLCLLAGLSACFVQHPDLIGAAEPAAAGQWSGSWVAAPLRDGDEPGFFHVSDVDPAAGSFQVADADADGAAMGDPMEMHLRRVGEQLFLDVRDKADRPWMLFVVDEATPERIVLAWKPAAQPFDDAIAKGDFKADMKKGSDGAVEEIAFQKLSETEAEHLAVHWRNLFTSERITLTRMADPD